VSIFKRGKKTDQTDATEAVAPDETVEPASTGAEVDQTGGDETDPTSTTEAAEHQAAADSQGPFDASEVDTSEGRLDLGALWIRGLPGMELRLEVEEATQNVVGATAVYEDSAVQLQAFAAPKTMGIWDDIRTEIAESIVSQGGTADEQRGVLGTELRTRMPSAGPDGRTVFAPARFVGVDGPRWFLRAVFSGRAAIDDSAAETLMGVVRETVVVRGDVAMAPREMLPLRLPEEVAGQAGADTDQGDEGDGPEGGSRSADDLNPFERGPEITEVR
jgi:hypothetical protein